MRKLVIFVFLISIVPQVHSADYVLKPAEKFDTLIFESDAKLEFIAGKTTAIEGHFSFEVDNPKDSLHGIIKVNLDSLKTSIATRDKDMKVGYLETDKFQFAYFEILSALQMPETIKQDSLYSVIGDGNFYLHGVKNKLKPELTFKIQTDGDLNRIEVTAKFHVLLEDYDIERPQLVILKVARQINIQLSFMLFQAETFEQIIIPTIYK